jgi:hypothetical protein
MITLTPTTAWVVEVSANANPIVDRSRKHQTLFTLFPFRFQEQLSNSPEATMATAECAARIRPAAAGR